MKVESRMASGGGPLGNTSRRCSTTCPRILAAFSSMLIAMNLAKNLAHMRTHTALQLSLCGSGRGSFPSQCLQQAGWGRS